MLFLILYIYHLRLHATWQPKKNNKKHNKDYIGLLGRLQTIIKENSPLLYLQGQMEFDIKTIMDFGQNK